MKNYRLSLLIGFITGLLILTILALLWANPFRPVDAGIIDNIKLVTGQTAYVKVIGVFTDAELVSPSGEKINLRREGGILVPVGEVERWVVNFLGPKQWADIVVTSYDKKSHWVNAVEDSTGWLYTAAPGVAITNYNWSD